MQQQRQGEFLTIYESQFHCLRRGDTVLTGLFVGVLWGQVDDVVFHNLVLNKIGLARILERRLLAILRMGMRMRMTSDEYHHKRKEQKS